MFSFDASTKTFALTASPFTATGNLAITLHNAQLEVDASTAVTTAEDGSAAFALAPLEVRVVSDEAALKLTLTNTTDQPVRIRHAAMTFGYDRFATPMIAHEYRHLVHTQWFHPAVGVKAVNMPATWCDQVDPPSYLLTALSHNVTGQALVVGALPPYGDGFTIVRIVHQGPDKERAFGLQIEHELNCTINPGSTITLAPVTAIAADDANDALAQYRDLTAARNPRAKRPPVTGWNSWDFYLGAVQREDMDTAAAACREKFGDRVQYIVVDEGYEKQWGVWEAGWKFPQGLADMAAHLRSQGFEPGVWTAPLMVSTHTPLYKYNPHWFARNDDGNINVQLFGYGTMAQLDITHPEVQAHLRQVYTHLREAGFTYFKCDFTQQVLEPTRFHDPSVSHVQNIRRTYQLIRECIGDDCYLLACGAPYESVIGIVDANRVSGDIHRYWGQIRQNIRAFLSRWWMQGAAGNVDPDFAIVRSPEAITTDKGETVRRAQSRTLGTAWEDGRPMNLTEAKVLLLACYLTGGDIVLGDAIHQLNEQGVDALARIMPPLDTPAVPMNLFKPEGQDKPMLIAQQADGRAIFACLNLTDDPAVFDLDCPQLKGFASATDFWTQQPATLDSQVTLAPRTARAWRLK